MSEASSLPIGRLLEIIIHKDSNGGPRWDKHALQPL